MPEDQFLPGPNWEEAKLVTTWDILESDNYMVAAEYSVPARLIS